MLVCAHVYGLRWSVNSWPAGVFGSNDSAGGPEPGSQRIGNSLSPAALAGKANKKKEIE
jgi:hypothetical protein